LNFFRDFLLDRLGCTDAKLQPENAWMETATLYAINYCNGSPVNEVCASSGIAEKSANNYQMYPNPAKTDVKISWGTMEQMNILVMDMMGRVVGSEQVFDKEATISCSALKSGNYLVQLKDSRGNVLTKKLIIE
jgi:hypothetical protein